MNDGVQTDLNNENIKINDLNEKIEQLNKEIENMNHENEKFEKENQTIKLLLAEVGQEKEFYLNKLKDIEFIIQKAKYNNNIDKSKLINFLEKILFTQYTCEVLTNENNQIEIKEFIN